MGAFATLQLGIDLAQPGDAARVLGIGAIGDRKNRFDFCLRSQTKDTVRAFDHRDRTGVKSLGPQYAPSLDAACGKLNIAI